MCGIAGILASEGIDIRTIQRMVDPIVHRGPDDEGVWIDAEARVGLGHRRLSIVDLSPLGHQPMESASGRYVLSYNGEIYNHAELRRELGNRHSAWRGHSDTETLLECIAAWGLKEALCKAVGMFALGLWDKKERRLHLARDRFGEKPLYYGWVGGDFVFASELKSIRTHPRFDNSIDRGSLRLYAARTYVPAPFSIYRNIYKLEPGCVLTLELEAASRQAEAPPFAGTACSGVRLDRYWSYKEVVRAGLSDPIQDEREALEQLERALAGAIQSQSVADVPVGAFLSGGIDSSSVVALYQKHSSRQVRTFSIGFEEIGFNEAEYAKVVARHFGTEHNERYVTVDDTREIIPLLPKMYDEPFADASQIPTHIVSKFAREQVKVALSGDGGDELFGGYLRHLAAPKLWERMRQVPRPARAVLGKMLGQVSAGVWDRLPLLAEAQSHPFFGSKVQKVFRVAGGAQTLDDVYGSFLDEWAYEESPIAGSSAPNDDRGFDLAVAPGAPDLARIMYCDAVSYLPDDILCKVDRASMAASLEVRVPFLHPAVAEVAARIPVSMKISHGAGKQILRKLLYQEAPPELFDRPKAGFGVPIGEWIIGPLRAWAEELIDPKRLADEGFFDADIVRKRWDQHLRGQRDGSSALWAILMFQAWHRENSGA